MIKSKSSKSSPNKDEVKKSLDWWDLAGEIFTALVVVGVGGELIAHRVYSRKNKELETIVEQEEHAKDVAADARSAQLSKDVEIARRDAEGFKLQIAEATKRAAEADAKAAQANLDLAKYKLPRTLMPEQRQRIIAKCRNFPGTPFDLDVSPNDEATKLMNAIEDVLVSAGWSEQSSQTSAPLGLNTAKGKRAGIRATSGVIIAMHISKISEFSNAALTLSAALMAEGIEVTSGIDTLPEANSSTIHIIIGSKP